MISNILKHRLAPILEAEKNLCKHRVTAIAIGLACLVGVILWAAGWGGPKVVVFWFLGSFVLLIALWNWLTRRPVDLRAIARRLEDRFPELDGRLLTAVEVEGDEAGENLGYLEERVVFEAVDHSVHNFWDRDYRRKQRNWAAAFHAMALIGFVLVTALLFTVNSGKSQLAEESPVSPEKSPTTQIEVHPGDTEVEKGTKLVVEARFDGTVPNTATLEVISPDSGQVVDSLEMRRNLDDPVFGTVVPRISEPVQYRVAYAETGQSDTFDVGIYVHPELEQADVTITPPAYAEQEAKTVKDVRKVTALEGSELGFAFKVNKPVAEAELFGEDETAIPLEADPEDPTRLIAKFRPDAAQKYRLHLIDADDRPNKAPPWFSVKLKKNQPPKLELAFPGKDSEVSALEEMALEGKVWDDLGVVKVGATVSVGEKTADLVLNDAKLKGQKKHDFGTVLALEDYEAEPTQLVSYHFWAEDIGPDGQPRRTESDMFFAEVRHWEHIFREGTPQQGQGQGQQNQSQQLRIQQKEIMNATWKLMRRAAVSGIAKQLEDVDVVRQGQEIVLQNVDAVIEMVQDPELVMILTGAKEEMQKAVSFLHWVVEHTDGERMTNALSAEKAAYQQLLKAESRESEVTRSQSAQSQGSQSQSQQRQLMQLELKQNEDRYETERQAEDEQPQTEQDENLAILARLKELAQARRSARGENQGDRSRAQGSQDRGRKRRAGAPTQAPARGAGRAAARPGRPDGAHGRPSKTPIAWPKSAKNSPRPAKTSKKPTNSSKTTSWKKPPTPPPAPNASFKRSRKNSANAPPASSPRK